MWVEFVVGSYSSSERFFSLHKNKHFQIPMDEEPLCGCATEMPFTYYISSFSGPALIIPHRRFQGHSSSHPRE